MPHNFFFCMFFEQDLSDDFEITKTKINALFKEISNLEAEGYVDYNMIIVAFLLIYYFSNRINEQYLNVNNTEKIKKLKEKYDHTKKKFQDIETQFNSALSYLKNSEDLS